jgi:pimeloyl-ACP methyl ester carboxylesterase
MQLVRHCTAALAAACLWTSAAAQSTPAPVQTPGEGDVEFTVFLGSARVGVEHVRLARSGSTWVISSTAQFAQPLNLTVNRAELKYTADWQPTELRVEATQGGRPIALGTSFGMTTAINEITQNGTTTSKTDQVSARTIVLSNTFFAGYEALAARLSALEPPAELRAYVPPQAEVRVDVKSVTREQLPSPAGPIAARRYDVVFENPGAPLAGSVTIDARARLVRLELPTAGLRIVRSDLAGVATRPQPVRNPTDTDVTIPALGFSLAGTLTMPPGTGRLRHPSVVLVAGSGSVDRDELVAGITIFAQLAGALAKEGFVVLRYDKRGVGQSGGRTERVALDDYADDLRTAVTWLSKRQDIDPRRIAVAGHSEGGAVAMLAATREKKIASLVLIAAPGVRGADLILEQQQRLLDLMHTPPAERQAKIDLQKRIQEAVVSEKGWDTIPPELRQQADTPWFRSLLMFDPATVMPKLRQPILIIQGDLDQQVFPHNADQLAELARKRKNAAPVEALHLPGINHLLVPAKTGDVSEYVSLPDKNVTPSVAKAIVDWLRR